MLAVFTLLASTAFCQITGSNGADLLWGGGPGDDVIVAYSCWIRLPEGCTRSLRQTNTPTKWFVDDKNTGAECQAKRKQDYQNWCRKPAEQYWGTGPPEFNCWVRLYEGCPRGLSETSTPTEWFVDPKNMGSKGSTSCSASRGLDFENWCGKPAQQYWGTGPPKHKCWMRLPKGCNNALPQADNPKNWFIDDKAYLGKCTPDRETGYTSYCGKPAEMFEGPEPPKECWIRLPNGCARSMSQTNTPTEWFIDDKNTGYKCSAKRKQDFKNWCLREVENQWMSVPPRTATSTLTFAEEAKNSSTASVPTWVLFGAALGAAAIIGTEYSKRQQKRQTLTVTHDAPAYGV